jgi:hypothetical protein
MCIAAACCVLLIHKHVCNIVRQCLKHVKTTPAQLAAGRRHPADRHQYGQQFAVSLHSHKIRDKAIARQTEVHPAVAVVNPQSQNQRQSCSKTSRRDADARQ